ncbi:inner membrane magnesium transporter MRS2 precursor [Metarhizium acridum CQMa 102]|uniref:Magnesium transporter n=1 Tax=Metarhizium acridum (strain CQMa 102) TaxID=655827 RepID=E9DT27_METAQ|nr:inner membrane magnesium transporter MRS2 precursor [Metarhizium acridum CQMa 102]EFY93126.1 inner membrane magnesium transporter MRS2 precursor [Metarhizium acridum CQMa 102]
MQPALRSPVPSRNLLRFLKSQSDAAFLAHGSPNGLAAAGTRVCRRARAAGSLDSLGVRSLRSLTTTPRGQRHVGSGLRAVTYPLRNGSPTKSAKLGFSTTAAGRKLFEPKSGNEPIWQERLWGTSAKKGPKLLKPDDLPAHDDFEHGSSMFTSRRVLAAKAALEPRLRCTEVDENGKVILVDGEFKKTELIAKFGLNPRDLRKIDSSNLPHILIRPSAILLNLLHLKVLIKHDRVLLFDVYGSKTSYPQSAFMYDLQGKLQQKTTQGSNSLPYEFRALEAVLTSVTSEMEADFEAVREPVMRILSELEDDIDRDKLRVLLILSKRVSTFEQKAKLVRDAIEELLEADDDLAAMYLTEKTHDLYRGLDDHTEVEMLLESYHKLTDEIVQEAGNLVSGIRNTEEIVRAILDANRNALMLLDLKFSVGTLGLAMGTFLAGLYGMNLENFIEETNWGFGAITGMSTIASVMVCWYGLIKLRKVQRIKMMRNERPHVPRSNQYPYQYQYHDDSALGLLDSRNREMLRRAHMQKAMAARRSWLTFWKA